MTSLSPDDPKSWLGLVDALRPPPGYTLHAAVGTTYGLDFEVLTAALLAFIDAEVERPYDDPALLVHALTRLGSRVRVLCQRGRICLPQAARHPRIFQLFDRIIEDVSLDQGGAFHPKVWMLSFRRKDRPETKKQPAFRTRLICSSRNLSTYRSWELAVRLDGEPGTELSSPIGADAKAFLVKLLDGQRLGAPFTDLARHLATSRFETSREMHSDLRLAWSWPGSPTLMNRLPKAMEAALLVSPFLADGFLRMLSERAKRLCVVSTKEELNALGSDAHQRLRDRDVEIYAVDPERTEDLEEGSGHHLHAKLLLCESAGDRVTFLGSANGSVSAWMSPKGNCEAMVEMRPGLPIASFRQSFVERPWVERYEPVAEAPDPDEEAQRRVEQAISRVALTIGYAECRLTVRVVGQAPVEDGLRFEIVPWALRATDAWREITQTGESVAWEGVAPEDVSRFVVVRARDQASDEDQHEAILVAELEEGTNLDSRDEAVRADILRTLDPLELLMLLLLGADAGTHSAPVGGCASSSLGWSSALIDRGLSMERVLEACADDPGVAQDLERWIAALETSSSKDHSMIVDLMKSAAAASATFERERLR